MKRLTPSALRTASTSSATSPVPYSSADGPEERGARGEGRVQLGVGDPVLERGAVDRVGEADAALVDHHEVVAVAQRREDELVVGERVVLGDRVAGPALGGEDRVEPRLGRVGVGVEAVGDRDRPLVGVRPIERDVDGPALHVGVVVARAGGCRGRRAAIWPRAISARKLDGAVVPQSGCAAKATLLLVRRFARAAVRVDDVEVQAAPLALGHEAGDDQLPAVRRPRRPERVGLATAMVRDRGHAGPVGIDGVDVRRLAGVRIPVAVERDPGAVGRPIGARRVELVGRDLLEVGAVGVDDEDRGLLRALHARERDARPVGRPLRLRVVRVLARERGGQPVRAAPVPVGHEDPVDRGLGRDRSPRRRRSASRPASRPGRRGTWRRRATASPRRSRPGGR